jgi:UDP-N-acetylmuramoyl-L-alanyl-D-glutamate--2,6-diaminopimelate ligase
MASIETLLQGVEVVEKSPVEIPVNAVTDDSRHIWPGSAFVAVDGTADNGLNYVQDAIDLGAALIILKGGAKADDLLTGINTPSVKVKDVRKALSRIAANLHGRPSEKLTIIGITGTNGKTTTGCLLDSILRAAGLGTGLIGTLGVSAPGLEARTSLTTPDCIELQRTLALFANGGLTHSVVEVSSHALELERVADVDFDLAIFTNFSQDHLDFHNSMDDYFKAKSKLFSCLSKESLAVINGDDPKSSELIQMTPARTITYGFDGEADIMFREWGMSIDGITGTIECDGETIQVSSPLIGSYNLHNILAAVAAARMLKIPADSIAEGIAFLRSVPGRVEQMKSHNGATIIIDYAHTPDAYQKLFSSLSVLLPRGRRLGVVFGCGGDKDRDKRPLMAAAAESFAERLFVAPDNPRSEPIDAINSDIAAGFTKQCHTFYNDRIAAIRDAVAWLEPEDILAVVGKGREDCQIVGTERIQYSEVETVKQIVKELAGDEN